MVDTFSSRRKPPHLESIAWIQLPAVGHTQQKAEQLQLFQSVFVLEVFQPSDHLHGLPLDLTEQVHIFIVLGTTELDAALQIWGMEKNKLE
ncbi:hypothetical protein BTVI_117844 [Pitangus sulphuratus]|nr:hypothetical protein BTVI_117844 [Pitangus sulphuratus]